MERKSTEAIKEEFRKKRQQGDFQRHVLEVLIYFASERGRNRLPTIEEFILSEVVAATIEYLTGAEYCFTYHRLEDGREYFTVADGWEWKTNKAMAEALDRFGDKLNPVLSETLKELTKLEFHYDAMGGKGHDSWLYTWYKHRICHILMVSTFSLSVEFVEKVKKEVIPLLDAETLQYCKAIATIMKKYIRQDVELIKRRYRW